MKNILEVYSDDQLKMSEVIFLFAEDILPLTHTKQGKENAILLAVVAWNIALQRESEHERLIEEFISTLHVQKNSEEWFAGVEIMESLIRKKKIEYPSVFRFIYGFEFDQIEENQELKIIASVSFSQSVH